MIDFKAEIKSKCSAANVRLMSNIAEYMSELHKNHKVKIESYVLPDNETRTAYKIDDTLTLSTLSDGTIFFIGCNANYKGLYRGILSTGMSFGQIKKLTTRQRIFNGSIIIDDDFGFSYILPQPYDEIADSINDIPLSLILEEIYISDFSFWLGAR